MTLLSMVQGAADLIGIGRPSSVIGSASQDAKTLLQVAQEEGIDLCRSGQWQLLTSEHTFTTIADSAQGTSAFPSNFARFVNETIWDRTLDRQLHPLNSQQWSRAKAAGYTSTVVQHFRRRGDTFLLLPTPSAGDTIAYEYVTDEFCQSSASTAQSAWAADTDTGRLDENLMKLGLVWRYKQARGLDYAEDMSSYELRKNQLLAADKPRATLRMGTLRPMFRDNVPETGFGQ